MPSGAKRKYDWATVARNFAGIVHNREWLTEGEACRITGFSGQSLQGFAAEDGGGSWITRREAHDRMYNRRWLYIKLAELYGVGWRDIQYDDEAGRALVLELLAQWWSEPQPALIDTVADVRPPPPQDRKMVYQLSDDPERQRGPRSRRGVVQPLQELTCQTCGTTYDGHPGVSTECRRCRSRTALLKKHAERRVARGSPPPGQRYPQPE